MELEGELREIAEAKYATMRPAYKPEMTFIDRDMRFLETRIGVMLEPLHMQYRLPDRHPFDGMGANVRDYLFNIIRDDLAPKFAHAIIRQWEGSQLRA